jgi:putative flippase GtrA
MRRIDILFAAICGLAVAWIAVDFFGQYAWVSFIILPILAVLGLRLADFLGQKIPIVRQTGKFVLSGALADVIDIKVFQFLFWLFPISSLFKAVSFLIATFIKYFTNKHWTFEKHEGGEVVVFFFVTLIGLAIDVVSFYYFSKISAGIPTKLWTELSIIFAALTAAVWNFLGYKFIVFKK